jgi:hypothetical protein
MKGLRLIADDGGAAANDITTHRDALRHTARRAVVAVSLTVVLTWSLTLMQFGTDPDATVRAGFVTKSIIMIGIIVSALLTAGLSYRSALVMRELALARAELLRISCTDHRLAQPAGLRRSGRLRLVEGA